MSLRLAVCSPSILRGISSRSNTVINSSQRLFHVSPRLGVGQEWRKTHGLPAQPTSYGALTDGPDYSFVDGRPTPPGSRKIKRAETQYKLAQKIIEMSKEVDFAVEFHKHKVAQEEERKANILRRKLKPKANQTFQE